MSERSISKRTLSLALTLVAGWVFHDLLSANAALAQDDVSAAVYTECVGTHLPYTSARAFASGDEADTLTIPAGWRVAGGTSFAGAPGGVIILCR